MENFASDIPSNVNQTMNEVSEKEKEKGTVLTQEIDIEIKKKSKKRKIKQEKVEKIIQKWLKLQKTIKEEITLEEVIIKQQKDDFDSLKSLFTQYYETKIQSRKQFEIIKKLEKNIKTDDKKYIIVEDIDRVLLDANDPIKNLLFLLRNNYDYITKLVSLVDEMDDSEKVDSMVELFCNQFYDNILIPNPEQEELLILIYKLLEEEITPMNSASIDEFLNDTSFIGKFISSYMNKRELKVFLTMLLNPLILSIENSGLDCMDMSLNNINNEIIKKKLGNKESNENNYDLEFFLEKIPKTTIHFKQHYVLENEQEEEEKADRTGINSEEKEEALNRESVSSYNSNQRTESIDISAEISDINQEYKKELTLDRIYEKIVNEEKGEIKDLYLYQLEQIGNDPDLFTNTGLKLVLEDSYFKNNKSLILKKYFDNFFFIKKKIDYIIQSLIDKISTIPYTVRCICKVISLLMYKKFPLLPKYLRNSFLGKFIFDKCIFPVLSFENKNVMDSRIFSSNTKKCLNVIISVLSNANRCCLYPTTTDTEKTIFNYYLIEIIPILNQFYEKVIDIELPKALEDLVSQVKLKIEQNIDNKIFNFRRKNDKKRYPTEVEKKKKKEPATKEIEILFDYFKENDDEIMHLESICFSLSDILFILELIKRKAKIFEGLPKYDFFKKTCERIQFDDFKLNEQVKKNANIKQFFIIFRDEKNSQLEKLLRSNKKNISTFITGNQDSDLICKRIKFCIKTILKGLNLLNNKDYSYLNKAVSSNKFFSAIKHTLNDLSEYSEEHDKIPLKWYGQYIYNYKKGLAEIYQQNDFEKLYEEIFEDEKSILNELKSFSSTIITRDGMNLRCAEKLLDKAKYDLVDIEEANKFVKIEKFIDTEKIEVCIRIKDEKDNEKEKNVPEKDKLPAIIVTDANECNHQKNPADENDKKNKPSSHAVYIKDFINKFSENPWNSDKNNRSQKPKYFVMQDIIKGDRKYGIYKTMKMYMDLVKKKIKKPVINDGLFNDDVDVNEIAEKIEDHILRQIYKDVFPLEHEADKAFYIRTKSLEWVTPEQLEIKKVYFNQLGFAISCIRKMDEARSVFDKISLIINAHTSINNTIKFSSGKDDDSGQDEMTPIFQYIILKAHPKRMHSNINYIKCFLGESSLTDSKGFLLSQIESATSYINNINYEQLKIPPEEFNRKYEEANRKYKLKKY